MNEYFHVYILSSEANPHMVKVGRTNNLKRALYFSEAGYAGVTDWQQMVTFLVDSNEAALALESMINAKLTNQGFRRPKIMWDDVTIPGRRAGATECYCCHIDHAVAVGVEMARIYDDFVA